MAVATAEANIIAMKDVIVSIGSDDDYEDFDNSGFDVDLNMQQVRG